MAWIWLLAAAGAVFLGTACAKDATSTGTGGEGGEDDWSSGVNVSAGTGAASSATATGTGGAGGGSGGAAPYPPGPYGSAPGTVIADYAFEGFVDPSVQTTMVVSIHLGDFYNPTGTDVYPPGSPYGGGKPKPKALFIDMCAVWAAPCNEQASSILPGKHALYAPQAGQFIELLWDSATPGTPATTSNLINWSNKYGLALPTVVDPAHVYLGGMPTAFPTVLIVNPRTMQIVESLLGIPDQVFWTKFEGILAL